MIPAIVLAGGLGTRLRSVVPDLPKPMADVAGKPFLWWVLRRLEQQGIADVYLSVGYRREAIRNYFGAAFGAARLHYVVEDEPLGTGGAIANAMKHITSDAVLVLNGDTMAVIDFAHLCEAATIGQADVAMAVAKLDDVSRYGSVEISVNPRDRIVAFREKGNAGPGYINAGIYWLSRASFAQFAKQERFSFEQDFLHAHLTELRVQAVPTVKHFIDIGVPEDYARAQTAVPQMVSVV